MLYMFVFVHGFGLIRCVLYCETSTTWCYLLYLNRFEPNTTSGWQLELGRWLSLFYEYVGTMQISILNDCDCLYMDVSENSGTPQIIHFNRVFHYKPSILGYHHFRNPPYGPSLVRRNPMGGPQHRGLSCRKLPAVWLHHFCVSSAIKGSRLSILRGKNVVQLKTRWWFQIFFMFIPSWGRFPIWLIFFNWVETTNQKTFLKLSLTTCHSEYSITRYYMQSIHISDHLFILYGALFTLQRSFLGATG